MVRKVDVLSLVLATTVVLAAGLTAKAQEVVKPMEGVWTIDQVAGSGGTDTRPQPAIFVFAKKHYSMVHVNSLQQRPDLPMPLSSATAAELVAAWGPSFNAQAGTYEIGGNTLVLTPIVAKSPNVMRQAAPASWTYAVKDGYLLLTPPASSTTYRLKRLE